jgi:hypothetical protein
MTIKYGSSNAADWFRHGAMLPGPKLKKKVGGVQLPQNPKKLPQNKKKFKRNLGCSGMEHFLIWATVESLLL